MMKTPLLTQKTWDEKKHACTVITMYPHLDGVLSLDLTTVLILNQLANSEQYGAVYLVNLFSNIKTPENLKHIKRTFDKHTDIHLMKAISESDTVIKRLHDTLLKTRDEVIKSAENTQSMNSVMRERLLKNASGYSFYNTSLYTFETLLQTHQILNQTLEISLMVSLKTCKIFSITLSSTLKLRQ